MHTLRLFVEGPLVQSLEACVVVALVWVIITLIRARHAPLSTALNKSIPEALGVGGILTIIAFAVPPDPGVQTTINLVPLVGLVQRLSSFDQEITLINVVGNIALFLPIGAAIVWRFGRRIRDALAVGIVLSLAVELLQLALNNGRSVDIDDVIVNGLGTLFGAIGMRLILWASVRSRARVTTRT